MRYPVFLERASDGTYGVGVPDLLGCISAGDTIDEALVQIREAIIFHLEGMAEDGLEAPLPRPVDEHATHPDYQTAVFWAIVDIPEHDLPGKAVRLNITMNDRVLTRLDAVAKAEGSSRSGLLQRLASHYVTGRATPSLPQMASRPASSKRPAKPRKATGRKRARSA